MRQTEQSILGPSKRDPITSMAQGQYMNSQFRNTVNYDEQYFKRDDNLDSQILIEKYRDLKQQQKQFLMKINLSTKLKTQIFGFTDNRQIKRPDENQILVTLVDPFKGRLIMKQRVWKQIEKQKETERLRKQKQMNLKIQRQNQQKMRKLQRQLQKAAKSQQMKKQANQEQYIINQQGDKQPKQKDKISNLFFNLFNKNKKEQLQIDANNVKQKQVIIQKQQKIIKNQIDLSKSKATNTVKSKKIMKIQDPHLNDNNEVVTQYNVKIQGNNQGPNLLYTKPANVNLMDAIMSQNMKSTDKLTNNQNGNLQVRTNKSKAKLQQRFKGQNQSQISQIPKREGNEDFSSPDLDDVAQIDEQSGEQFLPTKSKTVKKQRMGTLSKR